MLIQWKKLSDMNSKNAESREKWSGFIQDDLVTKYDVNIRKGKKFNVLRMKQSDKEAIKANAKRYEDEILSLYKSETFLLEQCPCCGSATANTDSIVSVYGQAYHQCSHCEHVFLLRQPSARALKDHFTKNETLSNVYTKDEQLKERMRMIVAPKADWVVAAYQKAFSREPETVLDVGAGAGHFVLEMQRRGFQAEGIEISSHSVAYAHGALGIELKCKDFFSDDCDTKYDLITMWGMLQFSNDPSAFISKAAGMLSEHGMLIVEVPRVLSGSTAIQCALPEYVWRHLLPSSHMNIFSDSSLATMMFSNGLAIRDAWYFGMDAYEMLTQLSIQTQGHEVVTQRNIDILQCFFDQANFSDDVIISAVKG